MVINTAYVVDMVTRELQNELASAASEYPVVTLLGPRQSRAG
jgi:hypothetical protein